MSSHGWSPGPGRDRVVPHELRASRVSRISGKKLSSGLLTAGRLSRCDQTHVFPGPCRSCRGQAGPPCRLLRVFKATQQAGCEPARGMSQGWSESTVLWVLEAETHSVCTAGALTLSRRSRASEEVSLCLSHVKVRAAGSGSPRSELSESPGADVFTRLQAGPGGGLHTEGSPGAARQRPQF